MSLDALVAEIRNYRGVTRKREVSALASKLLRSPEGNLVASHGEDAAAIDYGESVLLLAADGIMEDLISADPYWAGYCSVLVNVNDIAAMGGMPLALVNIISCGDGGVRSRISDGLRDASSKFGVQIVGGHLHPDTSYSAVDVAVLGETDRHHLVRSSTAAPGQDIVYAMDTDGGFTPGMPYSWDTTSNKDSDEVRRGLTSMHAVAPVVSAGKDISNPGALGSAGMMLEASGVGGLVRVDELPRPDEVELDQWLKAYQGCGFVVACEPSASDDVLAEFARRGLEAAVCGTVTEGQEMHVELAGARKILFDFAVDTLGCRPPAKDMNGSSSI